MLLKYDLISSKTRPINKRLRHIINESMCVADNISILTDDIINVLWKAVSEITPKPHPNLQNVNYKQIKIDLSILNENDLILYCSFYFFKSQQDYEIFLKKNRLKRPGYNKVLHAVLIEIPVIRMWFDAQEIAGSIEHELMHAYNHFRYEGAYSKNQFNAKRRKGHDKHQEKFAKLYQIAKAHIKDADLSSKALAIAVYMFTGGEITAFVNGLYKRLYMSFMQDFNTSYDETLYTDPFYKHYVILKKFCDFIENDKAYGLEKAANTYSLSEKRLITICKTVLRRMERGFAYAVQKAKLDYENKVFRT